MSALFQATIFSLLLVLAIASLTKDNLHEKAGDRPIFIKAFAPWCGNTSPSQMPVCTHVPSIDQYVRLQDIARQWRQPGRP